MIDVVTILEAKLASLNGCVAADLAHRSALLRDEFLDKDEVRRFVRNVDRSIEKTREQIAEVEAMLKEKRAMPA